jgi:PEP-CTERM motif
VVYSTIPTDPCRIHVYGAILQPIQFTVVDPQATSFFDIFVTTEFTGPVDFTKPLFEMTLTGDTSTVPEPSTLALVAAGAIVFVARGRFTKR